jgi:signal transduction histidine kinase/ActR/RegA family two-component response regulator
MSGWARYAGAIAIATVAVALRWLLVPWVGPDAPYATLLGAIAIAVWMGGWGPASVAAIFGFIGTGLVIGRSLGTLPVDRIHAVLGIALYALTCALIIGLGEAMRRTRDAHRRSQERFLRSWEAAIQGYGLLKALRDAAGEIVDFEFEYINPLGAAIGKSAPERVLGARVTAVMPGACAAGLFAALRDVVRTGSPVDIELADTSGSPATWLRYMIVKVEDGVAISFSDITQTKQLALELKQRAADLQRANAVKSLFLATLAHELRNPLAPIRNGLAILKDGIPADLGDIHAFVSAAIEIARPNIEARSHELLVHHAPRTLHVDGDPVRLAQVVANLLNNAAKFTPSKGRIEIWMRVKGEQAFIRVRDSGIGIAAADLESIFETFVQLDSSRSQAAAGLGLGLALARSLITLHKGEIAARSAGPGKGSEFRIRLPLAAAPVHAHEETKAPPLAHTPRRVLVVDDNVDAATSLGTLLQRRGHSVDTCFDGSTAFETATRLPPEVAFIDLNMPHPDGAELARMIRKQVWGDGVKLIALTGMGQPADLERTRAAGFDEHLTKPADPDALFKAVGVLRRAQSTFCCDSYGGQA